MQLFHILVNGFLRLVHHGFQDFLVAALDFIGQAALELRSRAGHLEPKHRRIMLLQQILLHQLKCLVIDRQCGRLAANTPRMRVLFLVIGEFFAECTQLVLLHVRTSADDTQCLIDPFLRLGEEVQTAVDARERQLFKIAVPTDFMQQTGHPVIKRLQPVFLCGEHFLG